MEPTYFISKGQLPSGMTFDETTGEFLGVPDTPGSHLVDVEIGMRQGSEVTHSVWKFEMFGVEGSNEPK